MRRFMGSWPVIRSSQPIGVKTKKKIVASSRCETVQPMGKAATIQATYSGRITGGQMQTACPDDADRRQR